MLPKLPRNLFLVLIVFLSCKKEPMPVISPPSVNNNFTFCSPSLNLRILDSLTNDNERFSSSGYELDINNDSIIDFRVKKVITNDNMGIYETFFIEGFDGSEYAVYKVSNTPLTCNDNFNEIVDWRSSRSSLGFNFQNVVNPSGSSIEYIFSFSPKIKHFIALKVRSENGDRNAFFQMEDDLFPMELRLVEEY